MMATDLSKYPNLAETVKIIVETLDENKTTKLILHIKKGRGLVSVGEELANRLEK